MPHAFEEQAAFERLTRHESVISTALGSIGGAKSWRMWKRAALEEIHDMLRRATRMELLHADLRGDMELTYRIRMPVPRQPREGRLVVGDEAVFHLLYLDDWRCEPPPGAMPLGLLFPSDIFAPAARPAMRSMLCFGKHLPAGIPPKELILLGYYLVSLQVVRFDESDPAGLFNFDACEFFRNHREYVPLTPAGLFEDWNPAT
ncbi:MAG: hypothetical protein AB7O62_09310 [Pirellulales bacterium]